MPKPTGERRPKRVCQVCLQYDDHPRIELLVTADGPLGLHEPGEVSQVAKLLAPLLPANTSQVDKAIEGVTPANAEKAIADLIPDLDERDAYKAWRAFLHVHDFGAHLDCYVNDVAHDDKPQRAIDAFHEEQDPDGNIVVVQHSWEDKAKIMPSDHALDGVTSGLKGHELLAHLIQEPAPIDYAHGSKP